MTTTTPSITLGTLVRQALESILPVDVLYKSNRYKRAHCNEVIITVPSMTTTEVAQGLIESYYGNEYSSSVKSCLVTSRDDKTFVKVQYYISEEEKQLRTIRLNKAKAKTASKGADKVKDGVASDKFLAIAMNAFNLCI